jgi:hypothetical protein
VIHISNETMLYFLRISHKIGQQDSTGGVMEKTLNFIIGVVAGALVGAAAGLFLTPASGNELRESVQDRADGTEARRVTGTITFRPSTRERQVFLPFFDHRSFLSLLSLLVVVIDNL